MKVSFGRTGGNDKNCRFFYENDKKETLREKTFARRDQRNKTSIFCFVAALAQGLSVSRVSFATRSGDSEKIGDSCSAAVMG